MYKELYRYLILHRELKIPTIGTFILKINSATFDFPGKTMMPPSYAFQFIPGNETPSIRIFKWLANTENITERDAVIRFNDFAFELKNQLADGIRIIWHGVGELYAGIGGAIKFKPEVKEIVVGNPVPADKVIHENAKHAVLVGEKEKTSDEMKEILSTPEEKKPIWWAYAFITGMAAVIFTGWYFSSHGLKTASTGNQQKIKAIEISSTHYELP